MSATTINPFDESLGRVARALVLDVKPIRDSIADQVWQSVPAYATTMMDAEDLRARVMETVTTVIECLRDGRAPTQDELDNARRNGERRALQGVSHAAIIQSFRQAERLLGAQFQALCLRMQVRSAAARAGRERMTENLDALESVLVEAYLRTRELISVNTVIAEPTLMSRLALGGTVSLAEVAQLAEAMGIGDDLVEAPFVAVAVRPVAAIDSVEVARIRHQVVARLGAAARVAVLSGAVSTDDGEVAVFALPWDGPMDTLAGHLDAAISEAALRHPVRAAAGEPRKGLVNVGESCQQALLVLRVCAPTQSSRTTVLYRDALLEITGRRDPALAAALAERYLQPLAAQSFLVETLRCYLQTDLSVSQTAERLRVHKNTISYRLRRIQELTGLDLRRVRDLARAVLAVDANPGG